MRLCLKFHNLRWANPSVVGSKRTFGKTPMSALCNNFGSDSSAGID
jgi:hypothetical protein